MKPKRCFNHSLNISKENQTFPGIKFQKKKGDSFINKQCFSDRPLNTNKATKLSSTPADLCRFTVERFKGNRWSSVWALIKPTYPRLIGKNKVTGKPVVFLHTRNYFFLSKWLADEFSFLEFITSFSLSSLFFCDFEQKMCDSVGQFLKIST